MLPVGAFVGAACRSLTPAKRVFERSEWRLTSGAEEGTGAFVGVLRGSEPSERVPSTELQGWLIKRLFEVRTLFILVLLHPQAASPQLSMHGSIIAVSMDCFGYWRAACLEASVSSKLTSFRPHVL